MNSSLKRYGSLLTLLVLLCGLAFGQGETGQVVGTVTDPQGLVVSGAKVTLKNVNTNAARETVANANGLYTFSMLQPGEYELKAEAANFAPAAKKVTVSVGSRNTVDIPLALSGGTTTVEVVGTTGGTQVETTQQELSQVVNTKQINELPTLTRDAYALVGTAGNVSDNSAGRGAGYNLNGQRDASTDILLDGGENVDLFSATIGQAVPLDSVSEFRVMTSNFSAEYGRASGGVVNVATKAGTNNFHGTVYEFWRGAGPSSNTYDNNATMSDAIVNGVCTGISDPACPGRKPNFVRNQFGYSVGGPVLKDKLFFFSSTEWIRVRSTGSTTVWVVDPAFIANPANFANAGAATRVQDFYNAYGTLKPDAKIFGAANHDGVDYLNVTYPVATDSGGGLPRNEYQTVARVDFNWTDKTQMYGRYALQSQDYFAGTNGESPYVGFDTGTTYFNNNFLYNLTHIWGPNVVSQTKFVFNRLNNIQPLNGPPLPTLYMRANSLQYYGAYPVAMPGYLPFSPGSAIPFGGPQNLYQIYQDLSWNIGKHQFRFGGQYIHTRDNRVFGAYANAVEVLGTDSGSSNANFMAGNLLSFNGAVDPQGKYPCPTNAAGAPIHSAACQVSLPMSAPRFDRANRYHDFAFYAQDSWKLHPRFTLNLGVRWEYYGVQHNNDPSFDSNFYLGSGSTYVEQMRNGFVARSTDPNNPIGGLWEPDYNNFAPRIGFAWDIFGDGKTSLRGGYGMAYERNFGNVTYNVIQNPPNYSVLSLTSGDEGCVPTCQITNDNFGPLAGNVGNVYLPKSSLRAPIQNMSAAYAHMWSLAVERELAKNTVLAIEYSGSRGVKQYSIENRNRRSAGVFMLGDNPGVYLNRRLNDQYTGINQRGQSGFSQYNGLNVRVQTTNLHNTGLSFVSNYTWSHAIDNISATFTGSDYANDFNLGFLNPFLPQEDKGDADYDTRHRWVFSGTWDTPWFNHDQNWFMKNLLGNWTMAPMMNIQSGAPFSVWDCFNTLYEVCPRWFNGPSLPTAAHDVGTPEGPLAGGSNTWDYITYNPNNYYNTVSCGVPGPGCPTGFVGYGYYNPITGTGEWGVCGVGEGAVNGCPYPSEMTGRNSFRRPGYWNMNLGLYKNISITERFKLQLRGEAYNLFNHSNLYVLGGSADASNTQYGFYLYQAGAGPAGVFIPGVGTPCDNVTFKCAAAVTAVRGGTGSTGDRRNIQLGIKLIF